MAERVNSFGYFLESLQQAKDDCGVRECNDPQLKVLHALVAAAEPKAVLDLAAPSGLGPTEYLQTVRTMNEFGLVKIADNQISITDCGKRLLTQYSELL